MSSDNESKIIDILAEVEGISSFLSSHYDSGNGDGLSDLLTIVNGYLARLPQLESEASYLKGWIKGDFANKEDAKTSATVFKAKLEGEAAVYEKTYSFVYRLNQNLIEIQRGIISQLSYVKSQVPPRISDSLQQQLNSIKNDLNEIKRWKEEQL